MKVYPEDKNDEKEEEKSVKNTLKNFALNTNIEGINNAGRSREKVRLFAWVFIFIILVSLTCNDIRQLVNEYFDYPVDVSTVLEHKDAIDFPSVTVCNKNRVSCRELKTFLETDCKAKSDFCQHPKELKGLYDLGKCAAKLPTDDKKTKTTAKGSTKTKAKTKIRKTKTKVKEKQSKDSVLNNLNVKLEQSKIFALEQKFLMTYLELSEEEKFFIGHQLEDLIKSCSFRGVNCLETMDSEDGSSFMDYDIIINPTLGNCYNIFVADESLGKSSLTGSSYGLSLVLNIAQSDYLKGGQTLVRTRIMKMRS